MFRAAPCTSIVVTTTAPLREMSESNVPRTVVASGDAFIDGSPWKDTVKEQAAIVYSCQTCSFRSVRETSVRAHIIAVHASDGSYSLERLRLIPRQNVPAAIAVKCPPNSRSADSETSTAVRPSALHERQQHEGNRRCVKQTGAGTRSSSQDVSPNESGRLPYECYYCAFTTGHPDEMDAHSEMHSQEVAVCSVPAALPASSTARSNSTCPICQISFPCSLSLAAHARVCPSKSPVGIATSGVADAVPEPEQTHLRCLECSFATNARQLLDFHVNLLHSMRSCDDCRQVFASKRLLRMHVNSRHGHSCLRCNLSFASREQLELHDDSVHLMVLTCSICGLLLPSELALEEHESQHASKLCTRCDKVFNSTIELKTHLAQIHPRNNLLGGNSCEACFHAFCTPAALITHRAKCGIAAGMCSSCSVACGSPERLLDHVSKTHPEATILECPLCPFRTIDQTVHMTHQLMHMALPPPTALSSSRGYQCGICERWTASTSSLRTHVNNHHRLKPYRCEFCEFSTSSSGNLRAHRAVRHLNTELSVKCDVCNRRYRTVAQMHKHVKKTHEQKLNYECEFCENRFVTELRLKRHLAIVHFEDAEAVIGTEPYAGITRFRCDECEYSSYSTNRFRLHRATHRERLKCPYCDLSFPLVDVLNRHINARHLKKHVSCTICGRRLPNESRLAHHVESCHANDVDPFTCESCGYYFESLAHLEYHRRSHLTAKNFECPTCRRSFTTAASLCVHRLRHSKVETRPRGSKAFVGNANWLFHCEQCRLRFKYKSNLVAHQASAHSSASGQSSAEKLFTCGYCHKAAFSSKLLLSYHIRRKHLVERTFACEYCDKKFYSQSSLNNHVVSVHTKAYKIFCPLCDKGMLSSLRLRLHVLHAHKDSKQKQRARRAQRPTADRGTIEDPSQQQQQPPQEQHEEEQQQMIGSDENDLFTQEIVITSVDVNHDTIDVQGTTQSSEPVDQIHEMEAAMVATETVDSVDDARAAGGIESVVEISDDPTTDLISQIILQGSTAYASSPGDAGVPERSQEARERLVHITTVDHPTQGRGSDAPEMGESVTDTVSDLSEATHNISDVADLARYVNVAEDYKTDE